MLKQLTRISIDILVALLILIVIITINAFNYPSEWNDKILKQKRSVLNQRINEKCDSSLWDIKGDFWIKNHFFSWHELQTIYKADKTCHAIIIKYYVGNKENFMPFVLK